MDLNRHMTEDVSRRVFVVAAIIAGFFLVVVARLVQLQLIDGARYRTFALEYGIRERRLPAERGQILDRRGVALVHNEPRYDVAVIPQYLGEPNAVATTLAWLTGLEAERLRVQLQGVRRQSPLEPVVLLEDASLDLVSRVLAWQSPWFDATQPANPWIGAFYPFDLRGVEVVRGFQRSYPDGRLAAHVLGYLKEIDADELQRRAADAPDVYHAGDWIGVRGIEARWDAVLRGRDGAYAQLVDARGAEVSYPEITRTLAWQRARPGATLRLALDARLQARARAALSGKSGSVVALDPRTGGVLAMVSEPDVDLARLAGPERNAYLAELNQDPQHPFYARATQAAYPPGSTYKIVVATAALQEGEIRPDEPVHCPGGMTVGGRTFQCWRRGGHGRVTLQRALAESCDVYFYELGRRLGPDRIARYAARFGLGRATGIDFPGENAGLIPTAAWKQQRRGKPWSVGDSLSIAIGQGYNLVTPLQAATMVATIANGGFAVRPIVVEEILGDPVAAEAWQSAQPPPERVVPPAIVAAVRDGLIGVVEGPGGTAGRLKSLRLKIAGKTGTAQVVGLLRGTSVREHNDHAWFVAFAPYDDPRIAVSVLVEHGGHGGAAAAPIAAEVIKAYLEMQP
ncbi:MAG: penicillin-binding protein 2 [Deltaproteobacteria bacterium]|nr:penicillin-binding protein 2 [Deltaproteobacteria bacterium]